jgi:hypothetical protein
MKLLRTLPTLFALVFLAGCASNIVTDRQEYQGPQLPKPRNIIVYDFAAPNNVPNEQIATARQVGASIAQQLVEEIRAMGLPVVRGSNQTSPQIGDYVLRGSLVSVDEGSTAKRVAVGFGAGESELSAHVEGYQMTDRGLRKLGSGSTDTSGGKSPGTAVALAGAIATANPAGLVVSSGMKIYGEASGNSKLEGRSRETAQEIAALLRAKFREQGWIQ